MYNFIRLSFLPWCDTFLNKWDIIGRRKQTNQKFADSIPHEVIGGFHLTQSFQPHYDRRVDSASKKNEYQESSCGVNDGQRLGLTLAPIATH
jgi:hypothetical protein